MHKSERPVDGWPTVYRTARKVAHEGRIVIPGPHVHGMHGTKRKFGWNFVVHYDTIDSISRLYSVVP